VRDGDNREVWVELIPCRGVDGVWVSVIMRVQMSGIDPANWAVQNDHDVILEEVP
jgi:hypothetical protein